jgi:hypothetical protein
MEPLDYSNLPPNPPEEKSITQALLLFCGWVWIMIGTFVIAFYLFTGGIPTGLGFIGIGLACILPIYLRERWLTRTKGHK